MDFKAPWEYYVLRNEVVLQPIKYISSVVAIQFLYNLGKTLHIPSIKI